MSPSVAGKPPSGRRSSRRSASRERDYSSPHRRERSPPVRSHSRSPSRRERSPAHRKSSHRERGNSPAKDRHSHRDKSPKQEKANSPISRSPSPRTKRIRRIHAEREYEKTSETEHVRKHDKKSDKSKHEKNHGEGTLERELLKDRREPRSGKQRDKDEADAGSSRSKHRHSLSPPPHRHHRSQQHSRSPPPASNSRARDEGVNTRGLDHRDDTSDSLSKMKASEEILETKEKQKPSFELSGKLAEETNRVRGVTLLFTEPPDARKPSVRWRLYVFKGGEMLNEPLYVHRQSCYLFGRERRVADIPTDHPSCSKQHAVLQFRQVEKEQTDGMISKQVRPYLMDLGSTNKTFVNENPIEPQRYFELFEKDTLRFGNSSREYVLLHENSTT